MPAEKIISVKYIGNGPTLDIEVEYPKHIFYGNGILTSNSHAVEYSMTSYMTAYAKANYPIEFYTSYLNHSTDKPKPFYEIYRLVNDAKNMDIWVCNPDLRKNNPKFTIRSESYINYGLQYIKGIGGSCVKDLQELSNKYDLNKLTWLEILFKVLLKVNKTASKALIGSGAIDFIGLDRKKMLYEHDFAIKLSKKELERIDNRDLTNFKELKTLLQFAVDLGSKDKNKIISSKTRISVLKGIINSLNNPPYSLKDTPDYLCSIEESLLGVALSTSRLQDKFLMNANTTCSDFHSGNLMSKGIRLAGQVTAVKEVTIKNGPSAGKPMAFISVEDETGSLDSIVAFSEVWNDFKYLLEPPNTVIFYGDLGKNQSLVIKSCERTEKKL